LEKAPDRVSVLRQYIRQFDPRTWSGSRASVVEANAKLLDELESHDDPVVTRFVAEERESDLTASSKLKPAWKRRRIKHETSDLNELWADVPRLHFGEFTGAPLRGFDGGLGQTRGCSLAA